MSEGVSRAQRENNSPAGVCGRGEGPTEMTLGASANVPTRLVSAHGRKPAEAEEGVTQGHRRGQSQSQHSSLQCLCPVGGELPVQASGGQVRRSVPTEGILVPNQCLRWWHLESVSESRWRQDGPVTRKVTESQMGIPDTVGRTRVPDPTGISHVAWLPVRLSHE